MTEDRKRDISLPADDFWDLGSPKSRVYEKPSFEGRTIGVTDVSVPAPGAEEKEIPAEAETDRGEIRGEIQAGAAAEKIVPREEFERTHPDSDSRGVLIGKANTGSAGRTVQTADGPRYVTSAYRRRSPSRRPVPPRKETPPPAVERSYQPDGPLIRRIDVKTWDSDVEFYGRFQSDARLSHRAAPSVPYTEKTEEVPYFSYVPQYAHMNGKQVEYYRWVRENIRHGRFPDCDLPYLQLYIFEILNLSDEISPSEGAELLASLWLGYRNRHPRLDGCLCDWLPDYCMIHGVRLPASLRPLLPELVPKAQFKEFYLNLPAEGEEDRILLSRCLIETLSDYDFRGSRYYPEHREEYETKIPAAAAFAISRALEEKRGMFALDRIYRMTRDSYCGAIASSAVKRRLDIEFCSFTRRAENRTQMTALVKYTENRVRALLGVKAKLGNAGLDPADAAAVDQWFAPLTPRKVRKSDEDRYMPDDYLKYYEAETSGFDREAAAAIERKSWINTSRLTGEDYGGSLSPTEDEYDPDPVPELEGELTEAPPSPANEPVPGAPPSAETSETTDTGGKCADSDLSEALRAALNGDFREYARSRGFYEGELADRINSLFLDILGDVVLEDGGSGFALIEDYREDVTEWLSAP